MGCSRQLRRTATQTMSFLQPSAQRAERTCVLLAFLCHDSSYVAPVVSDQALPRRPHAFRGRNHLQPSHAFHMGQIFLMPEGKWTEAQLWGNPGKPPPDDLPRINIIQYTPSFSLYFLFLFGEPGVKELRLMTCRPCMSIAGKLCTFSHGSSSLVLN